MAGERNLVLHATFRVGSPSPENLPIHIHSKGLLIVSPPKKRKVGRPLGSLNKKKEETIHPWQLEAKAQTKSSKSKKRSFGSVKWTLNLGEEDSVSITPKASIGTAPVDMAVESGEDAEATPSM